MKVRPHWNETRNEKNDVWKLIWKGNWRRRRRRLCKSSGETRGWLAMVDARSNSTERNGKQWITSVLGVVESRNQSQVSALNVWVSFPMQPGRFRSEIVSHVCDDVNRRWRPCSVKVKRHLTTWQKNWKTQEEFGCDHHQESLKKSLSREQRPNFCRCYRQSKKNTQGV